MSTTTPSPLDAAIAAALEQRRPAGGDLIASSKALVTIRDADGEYFVFRVQRRGEASGRPRPSTGYWVDVSRRGAAWEPCGTARENGTVRFAQGASSDPAMRDGATLALRAVAERRRVIAAPDGRIFTVLVEE